MNNRTITLSAMRRRAGRRGLVDVRLLGHQDRVERREQGSRRGQGRESDARDATEQLEDLEAKGAETQARLEQLRSAVPQQSDLAVVHRLGERDSATETGRRPGCPSPRAADRPSPAASARSSSRWSSRAGTSRSSTTSTGWSTCRGSSSSMESRSTRPATRTWTRGAVLLERRLNARMFSQAASHPDDVR